MRATLEVDGKTYDVAISQTGPGWAVELDGARYEAHLTPNGAGTLVKVGNRSYHLQLGATQAIVDGRAVEFRVLAAARGSTDSSGAGAQVVHVRPPMNGKLERLVVAEGQEVAKGDVLFVLEAMKMQNEVRSPGPGRVTAIHLKAGATVDPKHVVLDLAPK